MTYFTVIQQTYIFHVSTLPKSIRNKKRQDWKDWSLPRQLSLYISPEDTVVFDDEDVIPESEAIIDIDVPTKAEIYAAFKEMKNGTVRGVDFDPLDSKCRE